MSNAIIVGAGPNGLACAAVLATNGVDVTVIEAAEKVGGGARSSELTLPGLTHDECSAVHPMAASSPVLKSLELERHGLEWAWPEVDLSHPLDDGSAGAMLRSIEDTATGLGPAGASWKRIFAGPSKGFDSLGDDVLRPLLHLPRHPLLLTSFGLRAAAPATVLARALGTPRARALFGGVAAHGFAPLSRPLSSSVGMAMVCACHSHGWPVARGGSQAITDALASVVAENGGRIETGRPVRSLDELPAADAVVLDLAPSVVAGIAGERLPGRVARAYRRYKHGPGAFKVDLAVEGGIPWADEVSLRAGTVHVIGSFEELALAEHEVNRGKMPERPLVLVGQQSLADPTRARGGVHPIWTYAHVPNGYDGDATEAILDQIERFAPGLRERIVGKFVRSTAEISAYNANYVGGDIIAGANTVWQMLVRPRLALNPYATGIPGVYICSAATPPGGGVHGMGGYNAAKAVLGQLSGKGT
jgi:phytoene dehydrogenase-like protein